MLLAVIMIFSACAGSANTSDPDKNDEQVTAVDRANLTINGNDISLYTIVYADHPYSSVRRLSSMIFTEYDFYKLIAKSISERIFSLTGVTLSTARDTKTDVGEYEILVGPTNRDESSTFTDRMSVYKYQNQVKGNKLIIGGGYNSSPLVNNIKTSYCWASTYHAFDFIEEYITGQMRQGIADVALDSEFKQTGTLELKTVACIGDSITEGWASSDMNVCAYPAAMQRTIWQDYVVLNYGASGKTMRDDLADHYVDTGFYKAAVQNASNFDLVLIMLGTNDSDRDPNFSAADDEMFNSSAIRLADAIAAKKPGVEFVIMNCPAYFGSGTSGSAHVRLLQKALPDLFEENGYTCYYFDMYSFTRKELTSAHFPDALHPDNEGYSMMGVKLSEVVSAIFDGTYNK